MIFTTVNGWVLKQHSYTQMYFNMDTWVRTTCASKQLITLLQWQILIRHVCRVSGLGLVYLGARSRKCGRLCLKFTIWKVVVEEEKQDKKRIVVNWKKKWVGWVVWEKSGHHIGWHTYVHCKNAFKWKQARDVERSSKLVSWPSQTLSCQMLVKNELFRCPTKMFNEFNVAIRSLHIWPEVPAEVPKQKLKH